MNIYRIVCLLFIYTIGYLYAGTGFKGKYQDKEGLDIKKDNFYYVPIKPWIECWYFKALLGKQEWLIKYPETETGAVYADYRELQKIIVCRAMFFPFLLADIALLIIYRFQYASVCVLIYGFISAIIENIFAYPVLKHDYKRLKSYEYIVASDDEAILSYARRNPPALWKINTLLDVFFYFGEARIRYCESGNYLVYRLKNGDLLYIFLKGSFETMPEIHYGPYDWRRYNPAMGIWVDEIIVFHGNMQNDNQCLEMKNIKPQDMPENIC